MKKSADYDFYILDIRLCDHKAKDVVPFYVIKPSQLSHVYQDEAKIEHQYPEEHPGSVTEGDQHPGVENNRILL